jgi:malonate transporter and related proteins
MNAIFDVALPFFAVIGLGWGFLRWRVVDRTAIAGINTFVFYLALPALLIDSLRTAPLEELLDWRFLAVFYGASAVIYALVLGSSLLRGSPLAEGALRALAAVWGNWGYMGIPLLLAAFGPQGALVAVVAMLGDSLFTSPTTIALVELGRSGKGGLKAAGRAILNVMRNPLVLSTAVGLALAAFDIGLPVAVERFLGFVGGAASPAALFALGAALVGVPMRSGRGETAVISLVRLVLHPALVWLGATFWLPLGPEITQAAVVTAALPTAASVFVLAQHYDTYVVRASAIVLLTHLLSVVTLSVLLVLFID